MFLSSHVVSIKFLNTMQNRNLKPLGGDVNNTVFVIYLLLRSNWMKS